MAGNIATRISIYADDKASAAFEKVGHQAESLTSKMTVLGGKASTALAALGAGVGLTDLMTQAAAFESALTDMAKVTDRPFEQIRADIKELNPELGSQTQLMQGYYQVMSAGISDNAQALDMLVVASQTAKSAHTDQASVVKAITALMAGYEGQLTSATEAADLLFVTEKQGKTSVAELVPVVGDLASLGKQTGISFDEMAAALSTVTLTAGSTSTASTQLRAVMMGLLQPTSDMEKAFAALGVRSGIELVQLKGFSGSLQELKKYAEGAGIGLSKLFGSSEALIALGTLFNNDFAKFSENLEAMGKKAGFTAKAWEAYRKSLEGLWDTTKNLGSDFSIEIGMSASPVASMGLTTLNSSLEFTLANFESLKNAIMGMGAVWLLHAGSVKILQSNIVQSASAALGASTAARANAAAELHNAQTAQTAAQAQLALARAKAMTALSSRQVRQAAALETEALRAVMAADTAATAAATRYSAALQSTSVRATALAGAITALNAAKTVGMGLLTLLGGPLNAALMLGAGAVAYLAGRQTLAEQATQLHTQALQEYEAATKLAANGSRELAEKNEAIARAMLQTAQLKQTDAIQKFAADISLIDFSSASRGMKDFAESGADIDALSRDVMAGKESFRLLEMSLAETLNALRESGEGSTQFAQKLEAALEVARKGREAEETFAAISTQVQQLGQHASNAAGAVNTLGSALDSIDPKKLTSAIQDKEWALYTEGLKGAQKATAESLKSIGMDIQTAQKMLAGGLPIPADMQKLMTLSAQVYAQQERNKKSNSKGKSAAEKLAENASSYALNLEKLRNEVTALDASLDPTMSSFDRMAAKIAAERDAALKNADVHAKDLVLRKQATQAQAEETATLEKRKAELEAQNKFDELANKTLQEKSDFYSQLAEKTGAYGTSLDYQNQLLEKQKAIWIGMGLPIDDVNKMIELQRRELARDPWSGWGRAAQKTWNDVSNGANNAARAFETFHSDISSALTDLAMGAQVSFSQILESWVRMLIEMQMQAAVAGLMKAGTSFLGGLFGAGAAAGGAAAGGGAFGGDFGTRGFWSGHTGATVGDPSAAIRNVSPLAFVGAEKYHNGGMLGLRPDEVPFVGLRGERVLNPVETRAYNAGQRAAGGVGQAAAPTINLEVIIHSEGGQVQETKQRKTSFDGQKMVAELWIGAFQNNTSGLRNVLAQGA